ncbi:pali-domain-containing protein [Mycena vulgaris]|nr:pali-domain-containing protein [Mycena vulgaris]
MPQIFYISGIACLSLALLFNLLTTISLPSLPGIDVVRVIAPHGDGMDQLGIWGQCHYPPDQGSDPCTFLGSGYAINEIEETRSWSRGLAIQPLILCLNAVALALACLKHEKGPILASLASLVAAFFTFIAFIINIVFYANVNHFIAESSSVHFTVIPSSAIWLTFVSMILILLGGGTVFLGHRKNRAANGGPTTYYPMTSKLGL